jgi:hypothetical protein
MGKRAWWITVRISLTLLFVAAMGFAMKLYLLQEHLVVLLVLAISMGTLLVCAAPVLLFQAGVRCAVVWRKSLLYVLSA